MKRELTDFFAGIPVTNRGVALKWYERLFGSPPAFLPNDAEAVWELAQHRYIFIDQEPTHSGHARHLIFVDDIDALVAEVAARGLEPAKSEAPAPGVRKVTYRDPDGNEFEFASKT